MSLSGSSKNDIKLEAVSVKWGRENCNKVTFVDDVTGSLDAEYWDLNTLDEDQVETQYVVWLDNDIVMPMYDESVEMYGVVAAKGIKGKDVLVAARLKEGGI